MVNISKEEFEHLYNKFGPMVLRRCRFLLKDDLKAQDAMQDVFVRILESNYGKQDLCSSLFFTTATRICLNQIRSDKYRNHLQIENLSDLIEDSFSTKQKEIINVSLLLDTIFSQRDSLDKEIATLYYVDDYTLEETAAKVKMSVSGVRKRLAGLKKYAEKYVGE
ncbi:MAG: sigma-70 family RNA polymerase sigma factor [Treponema sp.]|nr:sigma-70 family RNA polymerase sigma factor [Treponema sp.]